MLLCAIHCCLQFQITNKYAGKTTETNLELPIFHNQILNQFSKDKVRSHCKLFPKRYHMTKQKGYKQILNDLNAFLRNHLFNSRTVSSY